jgi:tRNA(Ile)-lysidine synthase
MPRVTHGARDDDNADLANAIRAVPPGHWAVGVSGGADSVALLFLLLQRTDLALHVVHLDHETRSGASAADAAFVQALCARLNVPCTLSTRSAVERGVERIEANLSARYRAARLALFGQVLRANDLGGVILAHHADDQAETILHRLLRGSGPAGLTGMAARTVLGGVPVLRPLLAVKGEALRAELRRRGETWREDASNASDEYARNRIRRVLAARPAVSAALLRLAGACRRFHEWTVANTPQPADELPTRDVVTTPGPVQRELVRRWLARSGVPEGRIDPGVISRLVTMALDSATPPKQQFPGRILVRRRKGVLSATRAAG